MPSCLRDLKALVAVGIGRKHNIVGQKHTMFELDSTHFRDLVEALA